jgi:hypothetical protein
VTPLPNHHDKSSSFVWSDSVQRIKQLQKVAKLFSPANHQTPSSTLHAKHIIIIVFLLA